ncbi:Sulfur oxidation protein SoxZ [hydrothermal vent metagenome]|uniref:Sulfur oxidation protein SoxZ n=1 Tax=hydrothermal vent metagenome TaxID=652676 RepID=A0A3B1DTF3_9ZZZZ
MAKIKIKAKLKKKIVTVKALVKHPMMSYDEAKKKKKKANFITYITGKLNGKTTVYEVSTSQFLSKNPYLKFSFKGAKKGDKIEIAWTDLLGKSHTGTKKIS